MVMMKVGRKPDFGLLRNNSSPLVGPITDQATGHCCALLWQRAKSTSTKHLGLQLASPITDRTKVEMQAL